MGNGSWEKNPLLISFHRNGGTVAWLSTKRMFLLSIRWSNAHFVCSLLSGACTKCGVSLNDEIAMERIGLYGYYQNALIS